MITIEHTPFKTVQYFTVKVELDTTYNVEVEKTMNGSTEYVCMCRSYVDIDTKEVIELAFFDKSEMSDKEIIKHHARMDMVEAAVLNHVKKHGIGNANKEER